MKSKEIIAYMESLRNEEQREVLMRFFKTGPGEYGYGDEFLGLKVPQTREVVKAVAKETELNEVPELLMSKWHEVRLCGLLILVDKFERLATKRLQNDEAAIRGRDEILTMYLEYAERANNWDLVDLSAPKILGHWLLLPTFLGDSSHSKEERSQRESPNLPGSLDRDYKIKVLDELAQSDNLWRQRMSIVCTWKTSQMGDPSWCLRYAEIHLHHSHDLMHKTASKRGQSQACLSYAERERLRERLRVGERSSGMGELSSGMRARLMSMAVGWMLREMGKRCGMDLLREFLRQHAHKMPRTMLRYAIEKMSETERKEWMSVKVKSEK